MTKEKRMRALEANGFLSSADELEWVEVPRPVPGPDEVLIEVRATSPNPIDWHLYRGDPAPLRLMARRMPNPRAVGEDFAGVVVEAGPGVLGLSVGQRVFGTLPAGQKRTGAVAEYLVAHVDWVTPLAAGVADEQAGAAGLVGVTALQALRDVGRLRPGGRVLVWGAAGGVGHLAVQIARILGASRVDAVVSTRSIDLMRRLGADRVFDYTAQEAPVGTYDVIVDTVCTASIGELKRVLAPGAAVVTIGALRGTGLVSGILGRRVLGPLRGVRATTLLTRVNASDLSLLGGWLASGDLRVEIERTFAFVDSREAFALLEAGRVRGKLSIAVPGA